VTGARNIRIRRRSTRKRSAGKRRSRSPDASADMRPYSCSHTRLLSCRRCHRCSSEPFRLTDSSSGCVMKRPWGDRCLAPSTASAGRCPVRLAQFDGPSPLTMWPRRTDRHVARATRPHRYRNDSARRGVGVASPRLTYPADRRRAAEDPRPDRSSRILPQPECVDTAPPTIHQDG